MCSSFFVYIFAFQTITSFILSELSLFILSLLWFTFPCFLSSDLCAVYILVNKGINAFLSGLVSSPIEREGVHNSICYSNISSNM